MKDYRVEKFFKNKKVLVTGGLGFIGSSIARRLVALNAKVILVDSMVPGTGANLFNIKDIENDLTVDFSDMRDESSMHSLVKGIDLIYNLAGQVSHADSMRDPYTDLEMNVKGQLSLLEACRKNNPNVKIVFASTRQVYGRPRYLPVDEKHPANPVDVNGINKLAGEQYHILYRNMYGIKTVCLRMTNTYGPRLLVSHSRQGFIGWFIRKVIEDGRIDIFGDGKQTRDLNYIDDVVGAFLICGKDNSINGRIFNLGGGEPISLAKIAKLLIKINKSGSYHFVPFPEEGKKIDVGSCYMSCDEFKCAAGWKPEVSYEEGFRKTLAYYRKNRKHYF